MTAPLDVGRHPDGERPMPDYVNAAYVATLSLALAVVLVTLVLVVRGRP